MKKIIYLATVLVAITSCTSEDYFDSGTAVQTTGEGTAISFGSKSAATTRSDISGSAAADLLNKNFVVEGVKGDGTVANQKVVYDNYNVNYVASTANTTTSNTSGWEYVGQTVNAKSSVSAQTIKYWDYSANQYDFIAYSLGTSNTTDLTVSAIDASKMNGADSNNDGIIDQGAYTIKGTAANLAKAYIADMVTAYKATDYNKEVTFKFRPLASKVRVALYETVPGYSVNNVVFYTAASTAATDGKSHLYTTGSDKFNNAGTYTVYFPTTGSGKTSDTDYNKAHVSFTADATDGTATVKEFGTLDYTNSGADEELAEADGKYLGRASNSATYAGAKNDYYYSVVIPNETGAALNLTVDYTLTSTDGSGEVINVTGATAQVPAIYGSWKPGYAYTYIFKISQNTNGSTGGDVVGLYPITFDAVVTETEDGLQETITTVATPSITTYTKGKVVTANDEYKKGNSIYIVVDNGTSLTVGTNSNLYKVTIDEGAAQTINEASVANAIANGTYDGTNKTYTVTDANSKSMVVTTVGMVSISEIPATDSPTGNAITINGAKFAPSTTGIYAFEYINGTNRYYKIIKVVE